MTGLAVAGANGTGPGAPGLLPHHDGSGLHAPQQVSLGDTARLRVRVPAGWGRAARVWLRSIQDGEPRYEPCTNGGEADGWVWWEAPMTVTNPVARYRFLLEVPAGPAVPDGGSAAGVAGAPSAAAGGELRYWSLNAQGLFSRDVSDYADFRLTTFPAAPQWLRSGTMYQIFPDRFARSAASAGGVSPDRPPPPAPPRTGPCRAAGTPPRWRAPARGPRTSSTAGTWPASPKSSTTSSSSARTFST